MRLTRSLIALCVVASALSCGSPDEPVIDTTEDVWTMSFLQIRHDSLSAPPYADSTTFAGTLRRKRANHEWTLVAAGSTFSSLYAVVPNVDSAHVHVVPGPAPWQGVTLNITYSGNTISGSYSMGTRPTSTAAYGTFTGQRQ